MKNKYLKYIPILILEVYLLLTIILFEIGPIDFPVENRWKLYVFLAFYQLFLFLGYYLASNKKVLSKYRNNEIEFKLEFNKKIELFIMIMLIISIIYSYIWMARYTDSFSIIKILKQIFSGIISPGNAYKENLNMIPSQQLLGKFATITSTLLVAFYYVGIPLGLYFYKKLSIKNKVLLVVAIIFEILSYVIKGTNIGIFRVCVICFTIILLKYFINKIHGKELTKKVKKILLLGLSLISILFVAYFIHSTTNRIDNKLPKEIYGLKVDFDTGVSSIVPNSMKQSLLMIDGYLSQGYYGMSLALEQKFDSTFGIGNSTFLTQNIEEIFKIDIANRTYINKIDKKWSKRINWSTFYTWFANDYSFYGVVLIMAIFGFMIFKVIKYSLKGNFFAIVLLPLYIQICIFIPANNSILANPMTFMPFAFWHFAWLFCYILRRKYNLYEDTFCIKKLLSKCFSIWEFIKKTCRCIFVRK